MDELLQTRWDMDKKLTTAIGEVKHEVASAQLAKERTVQELSWKIGGPSYQFRKNGNDMQFNFNHTWSRLRREN